jgi:hypothetical protein
MKRFSYVIAIMLLSVPCFARDTSILPDKPEPAAKVRTTEGKEFWIETGVVAASWTADAITTHGMIEASPRNHEVGYLFTGSRSTPEIMGAWAAVDVGSVALAYEWKNHVHNRYLHPLWRLPLIYRVDGHLAGTVQNVNLIGRSQPAAAPTRLPGGPITSGLRF